IRQAPITVLDEPTANLDAVSETRFRSAIDTIRNTTEITLVIIGHRLSTVKDADQIIVLQDGAVSEVGRHQELLESNNWYGRAFLSQNNERAQS
ncbi:MAG: ABC transporter ATP-binding protein, partial [Pseudomonadota bacterium]|nr:ABC transporter ATP-binding protein [Pseudomonadota bacterium]